MAAEFHLAEDALALHLLLKHLEGLVDIVVTTRTCTRRSSSIERLKGPMAKTPGPLANGYAQSDADGTTGARPRTPFPAQLELKTERFGTALGRRNLSNFAHIPALFACIDGAAGNILWARLIPENRDSHTQLPVW
jgi:hypothetical protein